MKSALIILVAASLLAFTRAQVPTNLTVTMDALGPCNSTTNFKVGDFCQFMLTIRMPANQPTPIVIEIDSTDNNSKILAQICRPTITWGSNYNLTSVYPKMYSSLNTSQVNLNYRNSPFSLPATLADLTRLYPGTFLCNLTLI